MKLLTVTMEPCFGPRSQETPMLITSLDFSWQLSNMALKYIGICTHLSRQLLGINHIPKMLFVLSSRSAMSKIGNLVHGCEPNLLLFFSDIYIMHSQVLGSRKGRDSRYSNPSRHSCQRVHVRLCMGQQRLQLCTKRTHRSHHRRRLEVRHLRCILSIRSKNSCRSIYSVDGLGHR